MKLRFLLILPWVLALLLSCRVALADDSFPMSAADYFDTDEVTDAIPQEGQEVLDDLGISGWSEESLLSLTPEQFLHTTWEAFAQAFRGELLEEEIRKQQLLSEILRRKLHFLSEITPPPPVDKVFCRAFPQRYMITFGEPAGGSREHAFAFTRLERYLDEVAPILASDRIGVYADWHLLEPSDDYIPAVPMIFVERDAIESEHKRTIPPGDYLCMNYRRGELERYHPSFARLHTYMAEHGWVLNGMIFQFYKIDVTLTSDPDETLMEIQVPVRPAES